VVSGKYNMQMQGGESIGERRATQGERRTVYESDLRRVSVDSGDLAETVSVECQSVVGSSRRSFACATRDVPAPRGVAARRARSVRRAHVVRIYVLRVVSNLPRVRTA
jgi:hypothetical protein